VIDDSEAFTGTVIALMMEAVSFCETSASFYQATWRKVPECSLFHVRRRENLEFQILRTDMLDSRTIDLESSFPVVCVFSYYDVAFTCPLIITAVVFCSGPTCGFKSHTYRNIYKTLVTG
jgi:hypothetical protein